MRHRGLRSTNYQITNHKLQIRQRGYMLITLMLALALITIAMLTVLPEIGQQIRRDREEEMRHRGTAYMRAIQHFFKKFGRYPMRVEELENTNNLRFLRKRYKDPINRDPATGQEKDFKLLHQQDITLNNGPVLPGQNGPGAQNAFLINGTQGGPGQGGFGGAQGGLGGPQGAVGASGAQPGGLQQTGSAGTQNPAGGDSGNSSSGNASSGNASSGNPSSGNPSDSEGNSNSPGSNSPGSSNSNSPFNGPTFGGGPILGVASTSKAKTIRVFYDKNHYNDWLFIYVPQGDRGGLLTGPVSLNGPTGNLGGLAPGAGGNLPGQAQGQAQGVSPNGSQPQSPPTPPGLNSVQMPPDQ
jgi:type II secretory pathway pseudopilin PulG